MDEVYVITVFFNEVRTAFLIIWLVTVTRLLGRA